MALDPKLTYQNLLLEKQNHFRACNFVPTQCTTLIQGYPYPRYVTQKRLDCRLQSFRLVAAAARCTPMKALTRRLDSCTTPLTS